MCFFKLPDNSVNIIQMCINKIKNNELILQVIGDSHATALAVSITTLVEGVFYFYI